LFGFLYQAYFFLYGEQRKLTNLFQKLPERLITRRNARYYFYFPHFESVRKQIYKENSQF